MKLPWQPTDTPQVKVKIGQRFGCVVIVERNGTNQRQEAVWLCLCDCGKIDDVVGWHLTTKRRDSCYDCRNTNVTHGMAKTPIYNVWRSMIKRCNVPTHKSYGYYGGRGIEVCQRWMVFENFYSDMGDKPAGMSLDRIDNNGNYEPDNCRWATSKQQTRNKRSNRLLTLDGETKSLVEWSETLGLHPTTINKRIKAGWAIDVALTTSNKRPRSI